MSLVTIYHPVLDREAEVPAASVQHWRIAGWQEGPRPEPGEAAPAQESGRAEQSEQEPAEQAEAPDQIPPAPRRRRATERSE